MSEPEPSERPQRYTADDLEVITLREGIRKRPAMYVGSDTLFGFVHYVVAGAVTLLELGPRRLEIEPGAELVFRSDAVLPIEEKDGLLTPFEAAPSRSPSYGYEGGVLAALSESLIVHITNAGERRTLEYRNGERVRDERVPSDSPSGTELRCRPDAEFFTVTQLPRAAVESYLRRMSYLHAGVRFVLRTEDGPREFCAPAGIRELFDVVAAPYQVMHEPIRIEVKTETLRLEVVLAFQSWKSDHIWCFVNRGRCVEEGTPEAGLREAMRQLKSTLLPETDRGENGLLVVASLHSPHVVYQGCIKSHVGNPEFAEVLPDLITEAVRHWLDERPDVREQLAAVETFIFPDAWFVRDN